MPLKNKCVVVTALSCLLVPFENAVAGSIDLPSYAPSVPKVSSDGWAICNKSKEPKVWVAYSYHDGSSWVKAGWRQIQRNSCSQILTHLNTRYVYYYAHGSSGKWTGKKKLCAHPTNKFSFGGTTCPSGYEIYDFKQVDTGDYTSYTTDLVD